MPSHQQHGHCRRLLPPHRLFYCLSPPESPMQGTGQGQALPRGAGNEGAARLCKVRFSNLP